MSSDAESRSNPSPLSVVASSEYVDELFAAWKENPDSVPEAWRAFFAGFELGADRPDVDQLPAAQPRVDSLIYAYRSIGYMAARVDPLGQFPTTHPDLALEGFGFSEADLDEVFDTGHLCCDQRAPLREILDVLEATYCRSVGVEYIHIQQRAVRRWLQERMEPVRNRPELSREDRLRIHHQLIDAESFEKFVHSRYQGQKRFSLEGAEALIPGLHAFLDAAGESGAEEVVLGMTHRGRLNVLVNVMDKPYQMVFHEFEDNLEPERIGWGGDVKYHRGYSSEYDTRSGANVHLSLTANPSHLAAVCPVVEGRARAKQRRRGDTEDRGRVLPLLIHGDAAFAGQGLVAETFNLSQLKGYQTGGTVHIVVNNQIGFTTSPGDARSTCYPTDIAKFVEAPIFHVNGDDPEAVVWAMRLALAFRQEFHRDVVVDMLCYRRHGHNEGDEPAFTQPLMYGKIRSHPSVREIYQSRLEDELSLSRGETEGLREEFRQHLDEAFRAVKECEECSVPEIPDDHAFAGLWEGLDNPYSHEPVDTGAPHDRLVHVARTVTTVPDGFDLNRKIARRLPEQLETVEERGEVDWGLAERLAFGSLLLEGVPVRLSGQDSVRGTFSQRHAAWYDTESGEMYMPLAHLSDDQARFCAYNSMLSEAGVLGFDYGYALVEPNMLVIWEAQFGDFSNGAQVIIDQFVTAAMDKWQRACGLVMLLPHGYEGQGPEHSSAYLERYLALCAEDNIQVCNLSTPSQYFHALRRQVKRDFRRPLVIMAPKSLLRHRLAASPVHELVDGRFAEVLDDPAPPKRAERLLLCSGKVFYDLIQARDEHGVEGTAIVRLEQLYPLHEALLTEVVEPHGGAQELIWVQEETENRGAWSYVRPHLQRLFPEHDVRYVGREASASPAAGSHKTDRAEQRQLVRAALGIENGD